MRVARPVRSEGKEIAMSWIKGLLIALGVVAVLVFAIIAGLGMLGSGGGKEVRHISMGQRTITVSHYKNLTQETTADGVRIMVDGHTIVATNDAITIDGKAQSFDPTQDVEITVDEAGAVQAKTLAADAPRPDEETDEGADAAEPPQSANAANLRRGCASSR